jgi:hypothetical protein
LNEGFEYKVLQLSRPLSPAQAGERVASCPALAGQFALIGPRGARFVPDNHEWPVTFFAGDGETVEVVVKDLGLAEVEEYLCLLAQALGVPLHSETIEYC